MKKLRLSPMDEAVGTPVVLFVYNRPEHTRQVLEALKKNKLSKLYIFSDAAKNADSNQKVSEVRNLIRQIDWVETVIEESKVNKGLAQAVRDGVTKVLKTFQQVIVLEDDCVPSPSFVAFMENCLNRYQNEEKVMQVNGYALPIDWGRKPALDFYFCTRPGTWGWGTWRRAWQYFDDELKDIDSFLKNKKEVKVFDQTGKDGSVLLKQQLRHEINSWGIKWFYSIYNRKGLCLWPFESQIQNIGFDGSGTHCGVQDVFETVVMNSGSENSLRYPSKIEQDSELMLKFGQFYNKSNVSKFSIKNVIKKILKVLRVKEEK